MTEDREAPRAYRPLTDDDLRRIVGRVMQETHGRADPVRVREIAAAAVVGPDWPDAEAMKRAWNAYGAEMAHVYPNSRLAVECALLAAVGKGGTDE